MTRRKYEKLGAGRGPPWIRPRREGARCLQIVFRTERKT